MRENWKMKEMLYKEIGTDIRQVEFGVEIKRIFRSMGQNTKSIRPPSQ